MKLSDIKDYGRHPIHLHRFYRTDSGDLYFTESFKPFTAHDKTEAGTLNVRMPSGGNCFVGDLKVFDQTFGRRAMHVSNLSLLLTLALPDKFEEIFIKDLLYNGKVAESGIKDDYTIEQLIEQLRANERLFKRRE